MIVYHATKAEFSEDVLSDRIEFRILEFFKKTLKRSTSPMEIESWKNSMMYMDRALNDPEIPDDCGVAIEYQLPQSGKRLDFILTGLGVNSEEYAVVVELKQWAKAALSDKDGIINSFVGKNVRELPHPSYQVWSYATLLENFNDTIYKLVPAIEKNLRLTNLEALNHSEANKYKIYIAISENLPHCRTMEELEMRLLKQGIETQYKCKGQTQEKQGVSFKLENISFKGSQVDRKYSLLGLEKILALQQKQVLEQRHNAENRLHSKIHSSGEKPSLHQTGKFNSIQESGKDIIQNIAKGMEKAIEILMQSEQNQSQTPYELTQEALRKKRKKQSQQLNR